MAESRASEFGERLKDARFTREVIGPKVARPLAGWLERTFDEEHDEATNGASPVATAEAEPPLPHPMRAAG